MAFKSFVSTARLDDFNNLVFDCVFETEKGEQITKTLSYDDYKEVIFKAGKKETEYLPIGNLPEGYIDGALSTEKKTWRGLFFVPGAKRQWVSETTIANIPYPSLVFALDCKNGRVHNRSVFAVKANSVSEITDNTALFRYPYGNVALRGSICMGNISVPDLEMKDVVEFENAFFEGMDEGHYYEPGKMARPKCSLGKLVEKVMKKDAFPSDWLVRNGETIRDLKSYLGLVG